MKTLLTLVLGAWTFLLATCPLSLVSGATIDVLLATDQTPGDAGLARVLSVAGGFWDRGGRVWMQGLYRPDAPSIVERNAVWLWTAPAAGTREFYRDGNSVPYYVSGVAGPPIPMSVPRYAAGFGGYVPPANYAVFSSGVAGVPAAEGMIRALWTRRLDLPGDIAAAYFVVNDLESHRDGVRAFVRPQIDDAIIRLRASTAGLDTNYFFTTSDGGGVQKYFNSVIDEPVSGNSGNLVFQARADLTGVISGLSNVVRVVAASSQLGLPSLPGGLYSSLRILGVDPGENLLWEAGTNGGTVVLRGEPGAWMPLLGPGMPAPPSRASAPSPTSPLGTVGTVGLVAHGAAFFAEATYDASAGVLAGRAALLRHDGSAPQIFALEGEAVESTVSGGVLQRFTPGGYDWPDTNLVAFYGPVRGGTFSFESQALLLASTGRLRQLARQHDPLPVPANVDRIFQFRFPVLSAKPDDTVAFAAEVEFLDGRRQEILYTVTVGPTNRYDVILSAGDTFSVSTPDGPRTVTIARFNGAAWRPGTFDKLLVSVDLSVAGTSAVLLVDPSIPVRMAASLAAGRLLLRWPTGPGGIIESAVSLAPPIWSPVTLPVTERDGFRELEVDTDGVLRFFRIR